jgi:hypothetical protein
MNFLASNNIMWFLDCIAIGGILIKIVPIKYLEYIDDQVAS